LFNCSTPRFHSACIRHDDAEARIIGPVTNPHSAATGSDRYQAAAVSRSLWRRIVSAQESGLVLVIALMMAVLTIFGGTKRSAITVPIPTNATFAVVEQGDDSLLIVKGQDGTERRHLSTRIWNISEPDEARDNARTAAGFTTISKFLNRENLVIQTTNASYFAVMAVGMTAIIILAGIDLSIGSIYALAALLGAMAVNTLGKDAGVVPTVLVAMATCCTVGAACGFVNGAASYALRVHPFVITLGTMAIYRGAVLLISKAQTIAVEPESLQKGFFKAELFGVNPIPTAIMLVVAAVGMFVLSRTVFGRQVYAIGGNETAAKYAGIAVGRVKVLVYTITGALAGLSGSMYLGYFASAENNAGNGYELKVIAAAVIGGASLSGGRGSAVGAVLGAILVQLIDNALVILEINQNYSQVVMGAAIVLAVVLDQTKGRLTK